MATVFIWNNNLVTTKIASRVGYKPAAKDVIGHASMHITDRFRPLVDRHAEFAIDPSHVSWLPGEGEDENGKDEGEFGPNILWDLLFEEYAPDHVIRIPSPPATILQRMQTERDRHEGLKDGRAQHYDFKRKNCSRVLSRVLRSGWNIHGGHLRYGQMVPGLWTPLMVKRLALDLKGGPSLSEPAYPMAWNDFVSELVAMRAVKPSTAALLCLFQRRADNRGSSEAAPRFRFSGSALDEGMRAVEKGERNLPGDLLVYVEYVARGGDREQAMVDLVASLKVSPMMEGRDEDIVEHAARRLVRIAEQRVREGISLVRRPVAMTR